METPKIVVFVVKRYAVHEAKNWWYAVPKAKKGRYAVPKGGGGGSPSYIDLQIWQETLICIKSSIV